MKKVMFIALALLLAACEKYVLEDEDVVSTNEPNVILHFKQFDQEAFSVEGNSPAAMTTRAATDVTEFCSRLNIAITRNQVTRYTGSFFGSGGGGSTSDGTFRLTLAPCPSLLAP